MYGGGGISAAAPDKAPAVRAKHEASGLGRSDACKQHTPSGSSYGKHRGLGTLVCGFTGL